MREGSFITVNIIPEGKTTIIKDWQQKVVRWFIYEKYFLYKYFVFRFQNMVAFEYGTWVNFWKLWNFWVFRLKIHNSLDIFCKITILFTVSKMRESEAFLLGADSNLNYFRTICDMNVKLYLLEIIFGEKKIWKKY